MMRADRDASSVDSLPFPSLPFPNMATSRNPFPPQASYYREGASFGLSYSTEDRGVDVSLILQRPQRPDTPSRRRSNLWLDHWQIALCFDGIPVRAVVTELPHATLRSLVWRHVQSLLAFGYDDGYGGTWPALLADLTVAGSAYKAKRDARAEREATEKRKARDTAEAAIRERFATLIPGCTVEFQPWQRGSAMAEIGPKTCRWLAGRRLMDASGVLVPAEGDGGAMTLAEIASGLPMDGLTRRSFWHVTLGTVVVRGGRKV